jgi:hypothetical protein
MGNTLASRREAPDSSRTLIDARSRAAVVRALLDEFERVAPAARSTPSLDRGMSDKVGEQLVEELTRLARRMLEVAAAISEAYPRAPAGDAE